MLARHALLAFGLATAALGNAQTPPPATPPAVPAAPAQEKPKTIDDLTKDFTKQTGLVTMYRQTKGLADTVYMEIPESKLGKLMLLQVTAGSGMGDAGSSGVFHGMPIADIPMKFEAKGEARLQLISPNLAHRASNPESQRTIRRSFPDSIIETFEIKARQPERKSVLIDVSGFFKSDVGELSMAVNNPFAGGGYAINPVASSIDTVKDFPENVVVRTVFTLMRTSPMVGGPKSVPWAVSFNMSELPETAYKPRIGDPRVGYFTVNYDDISDQSKNDPNINLIQRWNLVKKDPSAAVSEPVKPIVFYIDNATPKEYRAAVRKGAMMYNEAFEKAGFRNALVIQQMPDDADWDIADLRYNVIRWTTGMPFAIALFRANPLTGEILNANINMDGAFASSANVTFDQVLDPASYKSPKPSEMAAKWGARLCDIAQRGAMDHANGLEALDAMVPGLSPADKKKYIDQYVTEIVAHEMGHCLGLRHNFIASTQFGPKELSDAKTVAAQGASGTVMDYMPYNVYALGNPGVDFYSQRVGTYDLWAIDYGYRPLPAATPQGEIPALRKIASLSGLPGHGYQSDGAADDFDPYVERFDLGREPLDRLERLTAMGRKMRTVARRKLTTGSSYFDFTQSYLRGLSTQLNATMDAARYLGGGRLSSGFIGDKGYTSPYSAVPAAQQRRALALIVSNLMADGALDLKREDIARLTFNPNAPSNETDGRQRLFPIRDRVMGLQRAVIATTFDSDVLTRMQNNEFKVGPKGDTLTMAELFRTANGTVWSEVVAKKPVSDQRRELQRAHLDTLCNLALGITRGAPTDAKTLAIANLRSLRNVIKAAIPTANAEYTKPHLEECLMRIDRTLAPTVTVAR